MTGVQLDSQWAEPWAIRTIRYNAISTMGGTLKRDQILGRIHYKSIRPLACSNNRDR